jgi:UPF0716 protein FxsA
MRPTTSLFRVFTIVPLVEVMLFIYVGDLIGLGTTVALVLASALLGAFFVNRQGRGQLAKLRSTVLSGSFPSAELAHGAMILVAGALLITPGFLTDAIGLSLLVPNVREAIRRRWLRRRTGGVEIL